MCGLLCSMYGHPSPLTSCRHVGWPAGRPWAKACWWPPAQASLSGPAGALDLAAVAVAEKIAKRARRNLDAICRERENVAKPTDGDCGKYALCKPPCGVLALRAAGFNVKRPPCVHKLPRYASCAYFEHEPGYSVCESFADYCLVDMDMSVWARLRLSKMLKE